MATLTSANGTFRAHFRYGFYFINKNKKAIGHYSPLTYTFHCNLWFYTSDQLHELADFIETIKQEANGTK